MQCAGGHQLDDLLCARSDYADASEGDCAREQHLPVAKAIAQPRAYDQQATEEHRIDRRDDRSCGRGCRYPGEHGGNCGYGAGYAQHIDKLHAAESGDLPSEPAALYHHLRLLHR